MYIEPQTEKGWSWMGGGNHTSPTAQDAQEGLGHGDYQTLGADTMDYVSVYNTIV